MSKISRRHVIASLGIVGGSALMTGRGALAGAENKTADNGQRNGSGDSLHCERWNYVALDPKAVADDAYRIYPDGGCMYALVGGVIRGLALKVGEPFASFPIEMMRYGDGGVGGWGSLCGVVNGAAALIGLFHGEKSKQHREELIQDFCLWYEQTALPQYTPIKAEWAGEAEPSVAGSVLCHVSVSRWCKTSGCNAFSTEKKERCRRLAADGAMKIVKMLNANLQGALEHACPLPEVKSCIDCHGPKEIGDSMGKMDCRSCHQFSGPHPLGPSQSAKPKAKTP